MILVIDNYDSFTYNLVQYVKQMGHKVKVYRNNEISIKCIEEINPDFILISPGPGHPDEAGVSLSIVNEFHHKIPILGVCLGHQTIVKAFGGEIIKGRKPIHGKVSAINHDKKTLFKNIPSPLKVTRYHSLIANHIHLPECLEVSASTSLGEIMAIRHKKYKVESVQFHPESIMTDHGLMILRNFFTSKAATATVNI